MAYYVDTGNGQFIETDSVRHAREVAQHAIDAAQEFRDRMGWTPFWGRCVEIRRGKRGLTVHYAPGGGETRNQMIVARTRTHEVLHLKG